MIEAQIDKVAKTKIPILLVGETGVGKEAVCNRIFEHSTYQKAFVKVNCGAIPQNLIESELFGYERGSFTGASHQKKGYFEQADGGTLLLDEIGELDLQMQVKLLRVLQERELMRIGGQQTVKVDFRLIAATNRILEDEVNAGRFRRDLFFRLTVMKITIPPLRERKDDIPNLANYFARIFCQEQGISSYKICPSALMDLLEYDWPGNIRELENTIQRAILLSNDGVIEKFPIPCHESSAADKTALVSLVEMERDYIIHVLHTCNGKIAGRGGAAEILGLKRTTLNSRIKKLGLRGIVD